MKNLFKSIASVAIVAMAFAGCSKEAADVTAPITKKGVTVRFNAEVIDETRATLTPNADEKVFTAAWEDKDSIGIYAYAYTADLEKSSTENNVIGTYADNQFTATFENSLDAAYAYDYYAYYPYTTNVDETYSVIVPFGGKRTQIGNKYNSAYDVMVSDAVKVASDTEADNAHIGKDADGNAIVFPMHRLTAIAYFHFTTDKDELQNEKVVSVTLTVDDDKYIASENAHFYYKYSNTETPSIIGDSQTETNSIELTYDEANRPTANDFTAWFNLLPVEGVTSVTVEIETENYVATIERKTTASALNYEAGKLYKVAGKIADDKWEATSTDYSGTYLIFGKPATGNYWYLSPNSDTYQTATDTQKKEISDYAIYEEDDNAWVISRNKGKYIIKSYIKDKYIGNATKGKASLVDKSSAVELIISESKNKGFVNIETETGFYFALNSSAKRFAFYQSSSNQTHDIKLIPYSFNRIETPVVNATADDNGTVSVNWNSIANAANYSVTFNGETQTTEETSKTFTVEKAGNYTISVVANPSDTETYRASKAGEATATIIGNPASAKISAISANALTASWDAVDGAASYNWVVKNGDNEVKSGNIVGTTLSLTDITLAADTEYVLYVKSIATAPQGSLATFTKSEPNLYSEKPIIKVAKSAIEVDADQATGTIAVTAENVTADAQFDVKCSAAFITATLSDDHATLSYTIAANDTGAERTGTITITLTEGAHSDSAEISVTQKEASAKTATLTLSSSKKFGTTTGSTLKDSEGNTWTMTFDKATPYNYNNSYQGQQFGTSKTNGTVTFTSTIAGKTIKSVSVTAAAGSTVGTVEITVNGESWGSEKLDKSSKIYTKTGNDSGEISITLKQNTKSAVYLGAISVIYQ